MLSPLMSQMRVQISSLQGFNFQDFISKLMYLAHGVDNFTTLRRVKDKGCDGIILSQDCVVAAHGPDNLKKPNFKSKVDGDHKSYLENWGKHKNWRFIVNYDLAPEEAQYITSLGEGKSVWGLERLLSFIESLNNPQKRKIAEYLGIDASEYLSNDYIKEVLQDLLELDGNHLENLSYKPSKLVEVTEKMKINYDLADLQQAIDRYELLVDTFPDIDALFASYSDDEKSKIKLRVIHDFNSKRGSFKEKLEQTISHYMEKYAHLSDDDYLFYIEAIMTYLFEQCLIGERGNADTSSRD